MNFKIAECDKYNILTILDSKITANNALDLQTEIVMLTKKNKSLICDFTEIIYVDSTVLSSLLRCNKIFSEKNNVFICCNVSKKMEDFIKLDNVLTIIESLDESIDYILFDELEKNL